MPEDVLGPIEDECRRTGRDFSTVVNERLLESNKMRRIPGILFVDSPSGGRVARVAGTGLEVFEIVQAHRSVENSWQRLKESFHWLSDTQLRAASGLRGSLSRGDPAAHPPGRAVVSGGSLGALPVHVSKGELRCEVLPR